MTRKRSTKPQSWKIKHSTLGELSNIELLGASFQITGQEDDVDAGISEPASLWELAQDFTAFKQFLQFSCADSGSLSQRCSASVLAIGEQTQLKDR